MLKSAADLAARMKLTRQAQEAFAVASHRKARDDHRLPRDRAHERARGRVYPQSLGQDLCPSEHALWSAKPLVSRRQPRQLKQMRRLRFGCQQAMARGSAEW